MNANLKTKYGFGKEKTYIFLASVRKRQAVNFHGEKQKQRGSDKTQEISRDSTAKFLSVSPRKRSSYLNESMSKFVKF